MQSLRLKDMIGSTVAGVKEKLEGKIQKPSVLDPMNVRKTLGKKEGLDEMVECLLAGDLSCFIKNVDWLIAQIFTNITLSCSLGPTSVDPGDSHRLVSSGACYTYWGVPGLGGPQACSKFDSVPKSVSACQSKCTSIGATYEAAGCDGSSIWCWCRI